MNTVALIVAAVLVLGSVASLGAGVERWRARREREHGNAAHALELEAMADKFDKVSAVAAAGVRVAQRAENGEDLVQSILDELHPENDHGRDFVAHVVDKGTPPLTPTKERIS